MKSDLHKVLHPVAGRPMLRHLLAEVDLLGASAKIVVVGAGREQIEKAIAADKAVVVVQEKQLGTAHAVQQTEKALTGFNGDVLILYGDVPLVRRETMRRMLDRLHDHDAPGVVVLGFRPADAKRYGRVIADSAGRIQRMIEYKDASAAERQVDLCNSGLMAIRTRDLWRWLVRIRNDNAAGEYYLPDLVMIARADGRGAAVIETDAHEVAGVNNRAELAEVEAEWQRRRRIQVMDEGATLTAPETVWFSFDTEIGRDVTVEPHVIFGPGTVVADRATIRAFSHIEGTRIGTGASIGPYARLRPGADIGERAHVGNFVEIKAARLGPGAKANHLSYIGDAEVGAGANVGAGTITCNYDGFGKYRTVIGARAFIGSNSSLVAPVTVGDGAVVAAGSVIVKDVPDDALGVARGRQEVREGWAARFRKSKAKKAAPAKEEAESPAGS